MGLYFSGWRVSGAAGPARSRIPVRSTTRVKSAIVFSLMVDGSGSLDCRCRLRVLIRSARRWRIKTCLSAARLPTALPARTRSHLVVTTLTTVSPPALPVRALGKMAARRGKADIGERNIGLFKELTLNRGRARCRARARPRNRQRKGAAASSRDRPIVHFTHWPNSRISCFFLWNT